MIKFNGISADDSEMLNRRIFKMDKEEYFTVTPRVLLSNSENVILIQSKDNGVCLEGEFMVMIVPYYDYEYIPFHDSKDDIITVEAKDGKLEFKYFFPSEQLYRVIIGEAKEGDIGILLKTTVYAVDKDLFPLKTLIGDLHSHTIHSDGFDTPESVVRFASARKLDFVAVTDHNNYQGSVAAQKAAMQNDLPITVINGEEYSSTFTKMHIISLGAPAPLDEACYNFTLDNPDKVLSEVEYIKLLCKRIKANGGISVLCHPLWKPLLSDGSRIDVPLSTVRELMEDEVFDAVEIVGGSPIEDQMTSQMQFLISVGYGATPDKVAYLGSTDSHSYRIDPICGNHFTIIFAEENTSESILNAIRSKRTVAAQILNPSNVLLFGIPRYCMFAQYCLKRILKRIK